MIGVVLGLLVANLTRLFAPDVPVVFFGAWAATIVLVWFVAGALASKASVRR